MIYRRDTILGRTPCYADKTMPDHIFKLPSIELQQFRLDEKEIAKRRKVNAMRTLRSPNDQQLSGG